MIEKRQNWKKGGKCEGGKCGGKCEGDKFEYGRKVFEKLQWKCRKVAEVQKGDKKVTEK